MLNVVVLLCNSRFCSGMASSKRKCIQSKDDVFEESPRYFLNPESVSRHLYCSICQDVFSQPQRAPCGHSYCKKCILAWLKTSKTCPEDRKPLQVGQMHHDFILENIIGDQMVACPYRTTGCEVILQLQLLASHIKSCDFNPVNQPEFIRKSVLSSTENTPTTSCDDLDSSDIIPSPGKPSLMLRLFKSDNTKKELLKAMFDKPKK